MATLTAQLTANVSGITSDAISIDTSMNLAALSGGVTSRSINAANDSAAEKIIEKDEINNGDFIYLRNRHASETITIMLSAPATGEIDLAAGQWAFFPTANTLDVKAFVKDGSVPSPAPILEIGIFSTT